GAGEEAARRALQIQRQPAGAVQHEHPAAEPGASAADAISRRPADIERQEELPAEPAGQHQPLYADDGEWPAGNAPGAADGLGTAIQRSVDPLWLQASRCRPAAA